MLRVVSVTLCLCGERLFVVRDFLNEMSARCPPFPTTSNIVPLATTH
jgi:hypothetical protein